MIQGGGFTPGMKQKTTKATIKNESGNGLSNKRGSVAMARTNDLNSATSQFFINVVDNDGPRRGEILRLRQGGRGHGRGGQDQGGGDRQQEPATATCR